MVKWACKCSAQTARAYHSDPSNSVLVQASSMLVLYPLVSLFSPNPIDEKYDVHEHQLEYAHESHTHTP